MPGKMDLGRLLRKLSPYTIKKGLLYLKHYGPREFWVRLQERFEPEDIPYDDWFRKGCPSEEERSAQRRKKWKNPSIFSIVVPAYHTDPVYLGEMIDSVLSQTYPHWELCLANASPSDEKMREVFDRYAGKEPRIKVRDLPENEGISENTNAAIEMAEGEWICFLDHDDLLACDALYEMAQAAAGNPDADMIYTDEDKVTSDLSEHFQPHFKPDFNLDLLRSNNYICHFLAVRRITADEAGYLSSDYDGAQDYDFIFRCAEKARQIVHIPKILYHWRTHPASTADNPASKAYAYEAGRRAIMAHLERYGTRGIVTQTKDHGFYRVRYPLCEKSLITIIIPNKDNVKLLAGCLEGLRLAGTYDHYEILIVENNSTEPETFAYYQTLDADPKIRVITYPHPFNYSAINNFAVSHARGDYLLFLNNDVTAIDSGWLEEMLGVCQRPEVAAVGAKLLYPDNTIQHAGIVVGMGGVAGAMFVGMDGRYGGYLHKANLMQNMSAVTGACMMVEKKAFLEAGGFTEELAVAFNDVDLCLKISRKDKLIVYDPFAILHHAESKTRGAEDTPEKVRRFQSEIEYMRSHWTDILRKGDPFYNPNLSLKKWNYNLRPHE